MMRLKREAVLPEDHIYDFFQRYPDLTEIWLETTSTYKTVFYCCRFVRGDQHRIVKVSFDGPAHASMYQASIEDRKNYIIEKIEQYCKEADLERLFNSDPSTWTWEAT